MFYTVLEIGRICINTQVKLIYFRMKYVLPTEINRFSEMEF